MAAKEIQSVIQELERKKKYHQEEVDKLRKAIDALQKTCPHKWDDGTKAYEYEGHDSHKTWYKCKICGHDDWF